MDDDDEECKGFDDSFKPLEPLAGAKVVTFLVAFGFPVHTSLDWRPRSQKHMPDLSIRVTGHGVIGKHTLYDIECSLMSPQQAGDDSKMETDVVDVSGQCDSASSSTAASSRDVIDGYQSVDESSNRIVWSTAVRLTDLRVNLHDMVKRHLGSSYQTYFCEIPFAQHFRPKGTTARLDAWCQRLAYCISHRLVPPVVAAETLRLLSVIQAPMMLSKPVSRRPSTASGKGSTIPDDSTYLQPTQCGENPFCLTPSAGTGTFSTSSTNTAKVNQRSFKAPHNLPEPPSPRLPAPPQLF